MASQPSSSTPAGGGDSGHAAKTSSANWAPETLSVHAGLRDLQFHPVTVPIYQCSTFAFEDVDHGARLFAGEGKGYIYSRMGNPTVEALEAALAALEGGAAGFACGSGMAAISTTFMAMLSRGDHIVLSDAVYGPTLTLLQSVLSRFGVECTAVDSTDIGEVERAIRPNTRMLYIETPGNPTLAITDLAAVGELARARQCAFVVDNTFCSPILQQPFRFGADVVIHSLTKFLNGHGDVVGGAVVVREPAQKTPFRKVLNQLGGVLPPNDSFLVHRGIKTLALRMERHCTNAMKIAAWLEGHPKIAWVRYPGLESHPQYEIGRRQMKGPGGLMAFELKGGLAAGRHVMNSVSLCTLAVSLGGVESLIQHPATMTHASMGADARKHAKISDGLVRLSVGIEDADDLIADLDQALAKAPS